MKIKVIKTVFQENQEIDLSNYIDTTIVEIISSNNQIVIENNTTYCYLTLYYKTSPYSELQKIENHKENLKKEIYNLIKEKYPTHTKIIHRRDDIADNYKNIKTIYDFTRIRNFGETTITKEKEILNEVLEIIQKYNLAT